MHKESKKKTVTSGIVGNFLLFFIVLALMFGVGEVIVRMFYGETTVLFPRYHTDAQYGEYKLRRTRPNSKFTHTTIDGSWDFKINAQGFRNDEDFEYNKPTGVIRVISLGDSHTQGYEVKQEFTFSSIIEMYLKHRGYNAQVINTGVSGFSTAEQLILLEEELVKYQPDFIVLGFYANDFEDNIKAALFGLDEDNNLVVESKRQHIPGVGIQNVIYEIPGIQYLSENSYFYSMLFNSVWRWAKDTLAKENRGKVMEVAIPTKSKFSNYEIQLAAALIRKIFAVTKGMGARLIILDVPVNGDNGEAIPSINDEFFELIKNDSGHFISNKVLDEYEGLNTIHVPHGHGHISQTTHTIFGIEAAQYIVAIIDSKPGESAQGISQ